MLKRQVQLTFTTKVLGGVPMKDELVRDYVAASAPSDDKAEQEVATSPDAEDFDLDEEVNKQTTGFHRFDGQPGVYDYHILGFLKSACKALRRVDDTLSADIRAYKKKFADLWFVFPRKIRFGDFQAEDIGILERPLRAQTPQGERVSLARSETVPAGVTLTFTVQCLADGNEDLLEEWLDYGRLRGIGQWRNASWGRFEWEYVG